MAGNDPNVGKVSQMDTSGLTRTDGSGNTISINLNDQESLILSAHSAYIAASNARQYIESAVAAMPNLSTKGSFKNYIGGDGDLSLYTLKAQEMELLAQVLHQHALDTFTKMVDVDELQAIEIGNLILNSQVPSTSQSQIPAQSQKDLEDSKQVVRDNPQSAYDQLAEQVENSKQG